MNTAAVVARIIVVALRAGAVFSLDEILLDEETTSVMLPFGDTVICGSDVTSGTVTVVVGDCVTLGSVEVFVIDVTIGRGTIGFTSSKITRSSLHGTYFLTSGITFQSPLTMFSTTWSRDVPFSLAIL